MKSFFVSWVVFCFSHMASALIFPSGPSLSRRDWIAVTGLVAPLTPFLSVANAEARRVTGPSDGNLVDLPPEAVRSYLQYRIALQTSADFYLFELQDLLRDPSDYGTVNDLYQANNNRGQGNPNRIEREFTNTFRIIGLSMPPEYADEMRDAQYKFERGAQVISKATAGYRRDLPVEIDKDTVTNAMAGWEGGRQAINEFFVSLNRATGLDEMRLIPPAGPSQFQEYGRSERRYIDLKKKIKLCQNRGGPSLSQGWGYLMVTGYVQDSCAVPDLNDYFYQ